MTKKHGIEILRPKNRNIEIRVGTKYPRHRETEKTKPRHRDSKAFFQWAKSNNIEIPRLKNTTSRFQDQKVTTPSFC